MNGAEHEARAPADTDRVAEPGGRVRRRVRTSDAEYRWRYEREVRQYVARHDPARCWEEEGPGALLLTTGRWAWVHGDDAAAARWRRYAKQHRGLKVMNPDGTWRVWEPGEES